MTLDGAIDHAEEVAKEQDKLCKRYDDASGYSRSHNEAIRTTDAKRCEECASEHRQLAEWLKDYKRLKEREPCEDAISRQELLNGLANIAKAKARSDAQKSLMGRVMFFTEKLPPVNPQETVSEFADRCKECGAHYGRLLNQKWTPISEGLPKEGKTVIASTKYGVYPEAKYTKEYGWEWAYEAGMDYWRKLEDVEAWMPLPERYKPKEDQG